MGKRHPISSVTAYLPFAEVITEATVSLGASALLTAYFTAAEISSADFIYIEPHTADAWIKFGGGTPAVNDGHQIAQHELREINGLGLATLKIFGGGAATITLFTYGGP